MSEKLNPALMGLATRRVWKQAAEKRGFQPPAGMPPGGGGAPPMDPAMAGGAPPMDPAMAGGAPPMDPAMAGGAPPMDPAMAGAGGMPPMPGAAPGGAPPGTDPMTGQKMKPEQYMQMLDFRLYNLQQQVTTLLNAMDVKMDPGVLVTPPGAPMGPPPEAALPGGPQDTGQGDAAGGGPGSAISPIEPMQGASPELAAAGGGGGGEPPKMAQHLPAEVEEFKKEAAANAPEGWNVVMVKAGEGIAQGTVDEDGPVHSSPPNSALNSGGHPGKRPSTQSLTAGGSKDPKSRTEAGDSMGPANKSAADYGASFAEPKQADSHMGSPIETDVMPAPIPVTTGAAAVAAMYRSKTQQGQ